MKMRKIGVLGLGHVGAHVAYSLIIQGIVSELVLVDPREGKLASEEQDLRDAQMYAPHKVEVNPGTYADLGDCDVIVNCILWDVMRKDHIIYRSDLARMKKNSMIIDVSCDRNGGIETSVPTTIAEPTYVVDGVLHYVVDHTPSLFHKTFTWNNSEIIWPYLEELQTGIYGKVLEDCLIIEQGCIIDQEINRFQGRMG